MQYKLELSLDGHEEVVEVIAGTLKTWKVWKVRFKNGQEVMLFKCGSAWMQRNEDDLDRELLNAIGEKIDHITWTWRCSETAL